jgi:hypothetical protein
MVSCIISYLSHYDIYERDKIICVAYILSILFLSNNKIRFARIRLTLRFELMCLADKKMTTEEMEICPSVGLRKIRQLSRLGGAHEDTKGIKQSASTPDLLGYFESMVH